MKEIELSFVNSESVKIEPKYIKSFLVDKNKETKKLILILSKDVLFENENFENLLKRNKDISTIKILKNSDEIEVFCCSWDSWYDTYNNFQRINFLEDCIEIIIEID